jgi:hypothetical protein
LTRINDADDVMEKRRWKGGNGVEPAFGNSE